jgi:hypothetical protein
MMMPLPWLGSGLLPEASVPMKLPWNRLFVAPRRHERASDDDDRCYGPHDEPAARASIFARIHPFALHLPNEPVGMAKKLWSPNAQPRGKASKGWMARKGLAKE